MTTLYDPPGNRYKIEVNNMGHFTVTRLRASGSHFNKSQTESIYILPSDTECFKGRLKDIPCMSNNKRNQAYVELINSQFE